MCGGGGGGNIFLGVRAKRHTGGVIEERRAEFHAEGGISGWEVQQEGRTAPIAEFPTKAEAQAAGREIAKDAGTDHIVQRPTARRRRTALRRQAGQLVVQHALARSRASAHSTTRRSTTSAAGAMSWISCTDWPANGNHSCPPPARTAANSC